MKTLSVRQPWAWLIVNGHKTVENRTWHTSYRGPLLIHAPNTVENDVVADVIRQCDEQDDPLSGAELAELRTTGAIVGVVDLVDCVQAPIDETDHNWHEVGCWAWIVRNPRSFEKPIPRKGRLGLFESTTPTPQ